MNTLSMLLPVYNARDDLQLSVGRLLDLAAEMSDRFELCVLDDGSTDDTGDTLSLLAACYPQIRLVRHPVRLGLAESIQTGLDNSDCETIVFGHGQYSLDPYDLLTLWRLRDVERRAADASRGVPTVCDDWLERLEAVGSAVRSERHAAAQYQMICRSTFEQLQLEQVAEVLGRIDSVEPGWGNRLRPNFIGKFKRFAWLE